MYAPLKGRRLRHRWCCYRQTQLFSANLIRALIRRSLPAAVVAAILAKIQKRTNELINQK